MDPSPSRRIKRRKDFDSWQSSRPGTPRGAHTPVPPLLRLDAASGEAAARHARSHSHARAGTGRARRAEGAAASAAAVHRRLASGEGGGVSRGAASRPTERPPSLTRPSLRRRLLRPTPPDGPRVGLAHATPSANAEHSKVECGRASVCSPNRLQISKPNTPHTRHVNSPVTDSRPQAARRGPCAETGLRPT